MVGQSYSKDSSRGRGGKSESSTLEGFAPFSRGKGDPHCGGGFASLSSGGGVPMETYQGEIAVQKQANTLNGTPINEIDAYLKATGGIKKSQVYGIGGKKKILYGSSSSSSSSQTSSGRSYQGEIKYFVILLLLFSN